MPSPLPLILTAACLLPLAIAGCGQSGDSPPGGEAADIRDQFHAPPAAHADPEACRACHQAETEAWEGSHHHLANAPLTEEDHARFRRDPGGLLAQRGMTWKYPSAPPVMLQEDGLPAYPVVGTIGLTPLVQYLLEAPDGRLQTHDVAWDTEKGEWFSIFEGEDGPPRVAGEWGHWTGQGMNWDANCAYCHMTEYAKGYDPASDRYTRKWTAMGITCAQCHPDMERHLQQTRNGYNAFSEDLSAVQIMETCATCHSLREELTPGPFPPGADFEDHYNLTLASTPGLYHPDGQVIGENYTYGSLMMSRMGHAGVTCMDCHDPHTNGHILPVDNNAVCMRCHGSGLRDAPRIHPTAHSHHPAESTGNRCVECHMPVTFFMGRDGRRDHSFSSPDPRLTAELGIPNACTGCHNIESVEWSRSHAEKWYGEDMNTLNRRRARLMDDLFKGRPAGDRLGEMLREEQNRFWRGTFVSMIPYGGNSPADLDLLRRSLAAEDPMIRAAAVRAAPPRLLDQPTADRLLDDPSRMVRIATSMALPGMPVASEAGEAELLAYLRHNADSPMGSLRLGGYWLSRQKPERAIARIRRAPDFEPANSEAWRLAGIQLHQAGATAEARDFLSRSIALDPGNAEALFNLGLLAHESGDPDNALRWLNQAVDAEPLHESAWYNLIVLYWQLGNRQTARARLPEALSRLPDSPRLRDLARFIESQPMP
jgi:predicted CXXCH cytochrome family protein